MTRPWRIRYAGAKYHVTSRGNGRGEVFLEPEDYRRFLRQLQAAMEQDGVILYAYVLMPNHYHLLVETPRGNIQRFMQRVNTAYSMYFRYKKARPGHCFQGRYGAKLVAGDEYLIRLTRYLHLNPVKTKRWEGAPVAAKRAYLQGFAWSSYRGYAGLGTPEAFVDYRWLALMGRRSRRGNRAAYRRYVAGMAGADDEVLGEADRQSRYAIGDARFREETEAEVRERWLERACPGDVTAPQTKRLGLPAVAETVARAFGVSVADLCNHGRRTGVVKAMAVALCSQFAGETQRAIAQHLGYRSESSVGKQRQALARRLRVDPALAARFQRLQKKLTKAKF